APPVDGRFDVGDVQRGHGENEDSAAARTQRATAAVVSRPAPLVQRGALAAPPGMMTIVGGPCVVVVVSRSTPPPATLPDVVVFWFAALGPSMRARQSALSLGGSGLQRSIAFCRAEPLLSRRLRLRSSCAAPASFRQVARSSAVRPASQSARSFV